MRDMAGGSYWRSLRLTLFPEFVSMNLLMAGMVLTMRWLMPQLPGAGDPLALSFWFVMSMALLAGFMLAYPVNWWLVARGLKHGMITVRVAGSASTSSAAGAADSSIHLAHDRVPRVEALLVAGASILGLVVVIMLTH